MKASVSISIKKMYIFFNKQKKNFRRRHNFVSGCTKNGGKILKMVEFRGRIYQNGEIFTVIFFLVFLLSRKVGVFLLINYIFFNFYAKKKQIEFYKAKNIILLFTERMIYSFLFTAKNPRTVEFTVEEKVEHVVGGIYRCRKMHLENMLHAEKYFRNLIKSTRNQLVFTIYRLIWNPTEVRLD